MPAKTRSGPQVKAPPPLPPGPLPLPQAGMRPGARPGLGRGPWRAPLRGPRRGTSTEGCGSRQPLRSPPGSGVSGRSEVASGAWGVRGQALGSEEVVWCSGRRRREPREGRLASRWGRWGARPAPGLGGGGVAYLASKSAGSLGGVACKQGRRKSALYEGLEGKGGRT